MKVFKSYNSYRDFERETKHQNRYIRSTDVDLFCQTVLETAKTRIESFRKGSILWRAQIGHGWKLENEEVGKIPAPHEPERMCPRIGRANEGRANPRGIPYLYLSSNRETALAEVRPWAGSFVSVGQFKMARDLSIVNCTNKGKRYTFYPKEPSPKIRQEAVWADIDKAFSRPITLTDDVADYVPTQVLSELFKSKGSDGIGYRSSLGDGYNIALFDIRSAEIINCFLYEVDGIQFTFSDMHCPYYLSKHYKTKKQKEA